ncbi:hypothetical protein ACHAW6_015642, partial [Cyclotella cf. meneghiniana]
MLLLPTNLGCIDCYADANFAGHYGHVDSQDPFHASSHMAFGCPVLWKSKLQTEIALSTMEALYIALSTACQDLLPLVALIHELSTAI